MIWLGPLEARETQPHEPTEACWDDHCHWHNVDELWTAWRLCGECGHGYETEKHLVAAYREALLSSINRRSPWVLSNDFERSVVSILWRVFRLRSDDIHFCPLCAHDF